MSTKSKYCDLDFGFFSNPVTNDVSKKLDDNAIKQSIYNLIMLRKFESPFHPEISSQVYDSLFETVNPLTIQMLKRAITYTLENFEPRIELISVNVKDQNITNTLIVEINYQIIATQQTSSYSFSIQRTR